MSLAKEFKDFILRGNVVDLAVGVIIGAAFGDIVKSLVNEVIMPPIGKLTGGVDFKQLFINLDPGKTLKDGSPVRTLEEAKAAGAAVIAYGSFLNTVISFIIVAACIFGLIKVISILQKQLLAPDADKPAPPPEPSAQEKLLAEIRDLLKEQK